MEAKIYLRDEYGLSDGVLGLGSEEVKCILGNDIGDDYIICFNTLKTVVFLRREDIKYIFENMIDIVPEPMKYGEYYIEEENIVGLKMLEVFGYISESDKYFQELTSYIYDKYYAKEN